MAKHVVKAKMTVLFPVSFTVTEDLPYVEPTVYPGSGSHNHGAGVYNPTLGKVTNGKTGYSQIIMQGLPNTKYKYHFKALPGSADGGLVYGTIDHWTRAFESDLGTSSRCLSTDPVGTECYIQSGFETTQEITTDAEGKFSWLFLHCSFLTHHFYGCFTLYNQEKVVGTTDFKSTK